MEQIISMERTNNRRQQDRRTWNPMPQTPFRDSNGHLVRKDRRRKPDRRLNNIQVKRMILK
jgi:hypothetical protein